MEEQEFTLDVSTPEAVETPEASVEPITEEPTAELHVLPDGRKVDNATLSREWKENFMPDYTKKSQIIAEYEKVGKPISNQPEVLEWQQEGYQPKSWAEAFKIAENLAVEKIRSENLQQEQERAQVSAAIDSQLTELKQADPKLDENLLFQHATKYGFRDLKMAHQNLRAIKQTEMDTEQRVLKNLKTRGSEPISSNPSATAPVSGMDYSEATSSESAIDFLRRIKT